LTCIKNGGGPNGQEPAEPRSIDLRQCGDEAFLILKEDDILGVIDEPNISARAA
jgi:hypothetical protein